MIRVEIDMRDTLARFSHIEKELRQALRAAVNATASQARKNFIKAATADIGGKVKSSDVRAFVTPVRRAGTASLTASFTAKNSGFRRTPGIISMLRGNQYKKGGGKVSTFNTSGGGSNPLTSGKLFMIANNGGRIVLVRHGKKLKRIYAEGPGSALGLERAAPRKALMIAAPEMLQREISTRVQAVLDGGSGASEGAGE